MRVNIAVCVSDHETQLSFIFYFNNHFLFINLSIYYTLTYFTFLQNIYELFLESREKDTNIVF